MADNALRQIRQRIFVEQIYRTLVSTFFLLFSVSGCNREALKEFGKHGPPEFRDLVEIFELGGIGALIFVLILAVLFSFLGDKIERSIKGDRSRERFRKYYYTIITFIVIGLFLAFLKSNSE